MALNPAQYEAVHFQKGPAMVLAGPGSGKTMVITHRVRNLIEEYGVDPANILVITFTKAAAVEMQARFEGLMGGERLPVSFGTFHAVFFRILRLAYNYSADNIVRTEQQRAFVKELMDGEDLDVEDENEKISALLSEISLVKGDRVDLNHYYSRNCTTAAFRRIYDGYEERLRQASLIDYDDMLTLCYELFSERADILGAWQNKYRYILIDEFQDINRVQYDIIRMMARPRDNLFIVGDDDQSIYRFRGARPEIMLGFPKDYPGCKKLLLDINYRSVPAVVESAGTLIRQNRARFDKNIRPAQSGAEKVTVVSFPTIMEENDAVIRKLQYYHSQGIPYEDMALLYRTNSNPRVMAEQLIRCNLPFTMNDVLPNLYDHWIAGDILTYLLIAAGSRERGDFLRIINRPKRYIGRSAFPLPKVDLEALKENVGDKEWMLERVERLEYDLKMIARMRPWPAINYIRKTVEYDSFIREYAEYRKIRPDELFQVLDELQESAEPYNSLEEWMEHMRDYSVELQQQKNGSSREKRGVNITTMHSSKGLEYRVVFLLDANEEITPHRKAVLDADIEEERRLFYVAMTRAKTYLHIGFVRERFNRDMKMSRFVRETGLPVRIAKE